MSFGAGKLPQGNSSCVSSTQGEIGKGAQRGDSEGLLYVAESLADFSCFVFGTF